MSDLADLPFPIIRQAPIPPDLYAGESHVYEPGICMRPYCGLPRLQNSDGGEVSVLCEDHTEEVKSGATRAPPLRPFRDYESVVRRTFLIEDYPFKKTED